MPRDMAMERPNARIDRVVLHNDISVRRQQLHIASLWIPTVHDTAVPRARAFVQHVHVVPVQMHRVRYGSRVFDNQSHRGGGAGVEDVPFRVVGIGCVAGVCEQEYGRVEVGPEGDGVDGPEEVASAVHHGPHGKIDGFGGVGDWSYGVDGGGGG